MKKYLNFLVGEKESILEQHRSAIKKTLLMEDEGILPDKTISGTGADKYDYKREKGKYYTKLKTATNWTDIETFNVTTATTTVTKTYPVSSDTNWLRISYTAQADATGTIDKVIARL
jgi:hypothetical protein